MERPAAEAATRRYTKYVNQPELAGLLPVLYPGVFPNLAAYDKPRADLNAILMTGIPEGVVPGFQNFTGPVQADLLRLNVAIPPTASPNNLGLVAGDAAGFPNGRRIDDDVVTIELRAVAGLTIPLVDPSFTPDGAASAVTGRDDEHQRGAADRRSRTSGCPVAATRRCPAPRRRHEPRSRHVENPYAGQGSVLLDIGGEVGALVVTMPAAMEGVEIELDRRVRAMPTGGTARTSRS